MFRRLTLAFAALSLVPLGASMAYAQGNCPTCNLPPGCRGEGNKKKNNPECEAINLTVETDLDFGRVLIFGDGVGTVMIDLNSGQKVVAGELDDFGGFALSGHVVVTGQPSRVVNIEFPANVALTDPAGGEAQVSNFKTNLPALALLDSNGQLEFRFTGTLHTTSISAIGGNLRGRFPIRVEYD